MLLHGCLQMQNRRFLQILQPPDLPLMLLSRILELYSLLSVSPLHRRDIFLLFLRNNQFCQFPFTIQFFGVLRHLIMLFSPKAFNTRFIHFTLPSAYIAAEL